MTYKSDSSSAPFGSSHFIFGLILMQLQLNFDNSEAFNSARVSTLAGIVHHPHKIVYANGVR
jgi:hypothetical protein